MGQILLKNLRIPVITTNQMKQVDQIAIEKYGIQLIQMMELITQTQLVEHLLFPVQMMMTMMTMTMMMTMMTMMLMMEMMTTMMKMTTMTTMMK